MSEWKYQSPTYSSSGYEDVMDFLQSVTKERYKSATDEERVALLKSVYDIYRERDIFPITYFNEEGIRGEIQKGIDYEAKIVDDVVGCGPGICTALCNFMMPNLYDAYNQHSCYGSSEMDKESGNRKFHNEWYLNKVLVYAISCAGDATPKNVMAGIRQVGTLPSNFRPMNAKSLYEKYCPVGGIIHDSSCGFGGRLTGALTSKNNYSYVGTEPNTETIKNLNRLGKAIESVTGRSNSFKIIPMGSEDFRGNECIFDFGFTSPPYFDLEVYSDEPTQCYNRYPNIYEWLEMFVKKTIENEFYMLKHDRYYAVNIADFEYSNRLMNYVDIWKDYAVGAGFEYVKDLKMKIPVHFGNGESRKEVGMKKGKSERILLFYKR